MPLTERQILDALAAVRDPDKGGDIVALGMVSGVVVRDGNVGFAIEVEAERGPRLEPLRKAAETAVEALPGVLSVTAVQRLDRRLGGLTQWLEPRAAETAVEALPGVLSVTAVLTAEARPHAPARGATPPAAAQPAAGGKAALAPGVRAIVAVASGKGGVGKSTVAANLALAMKRSEERRVG